MLTKLAEFMKYKVLSIREMNSCLRMSCNYTNNWNVVHELKYMIGREPRFNFVCDFEESFQRETEILKFYYELMLEVKEYYLKNKSNFSLMNPLDKLCQIFHNMRVLTDKSHVNGNISDLRKKQEIEILFLEKAKTLWESIKTGELLAEFPDFEEFL